MVAGVGMYLLVHSCLHFRLIWRDKKKGSFQIDIKNKTNGKDWSLFPRRGLKKEGNWSAHPHTADDVHRHLRIHKVLYVFPTQNPLEIYNDI